MTALFIRLHPHDNVVVAGADLPAGTRLEGINISCLQAIPSGHKVAVRPIAAGEAVRKYDQIIGFATADIAAGAHVHVHNLGMGELFSRDPAFCVDAKLTQFVPESQRATFQGIVRADGRIATRNYIGILTTVNCSASAARLAADQFRGAALADYPHIDGVVALTHGTGCGMSAEGEAMDVLRRTIAGYARHPNFAAVFVLGLGCENNQISRLLETQALTQGERLQAFAIQDLGGTSAAVKELTGRIRELLPVVNAVKREPVPVSALKIGLQCGGSDGYSGITANPALGVAADMLVRQGGTAILSETPEIYGAEHLLTRRAVTPEVGQKLMNRLAWWTTYTARTGDEMNNNPSAGNKKGGLTTILEKSLGAVAKGGTTALQDVYQYAEPVTTPGFVYMDTPGYDPVSATGQVAGGANMICFTTGRGSVFGCKPAPSLKLATNSTLYQRMTDDMDINCGPIATGEVSIEEKGQEIFETILKTASGAPTKSEQLGIGADEFAPWQMGAVM